MTSSPDLSSGVSDYLWFDSEILGPAPASAPVLIHGMRSDTDKRGRLSLQMRPQGDDWLLTAKWSSPRRNSPTVPPIPTAPARLRPGLDTVTVAYGLIHRLIMSEAHYRGYSRLHAAVVDIDGHRVLLAGPSGSGKTTLALALARAGADIQSDEGALIGHGISYGLPRRVHVKHSGRRHLGSALAHSVKLDFQPPVYAADPALLNSSRILHPRPVEMIVLLGPRTGPEALEPVSSCDAVTALLAEADTYVSSPEPDTATRSRLVAEVARLVSSAPVTRLRGYSTPEAIQAIAAGLDR